MPDAKRQCGSIGSEVLQERRGPWTVTKVGGQYTRMLSLRIFQADKA
jgi:hypothetical protein